MKRAMVSGISGFVGRHFAAQLLMQGWHVRGCDTQLKYDAMELFMNQDGDGHRYDLVVHAAYQVGGRAGIDGSSSGTNGNFIHNVLLDAAMFRWAHRTRQHRVLYLSSSAIYPVNQQGSGWEDYRLREDLLDLSKPLKTGSIGIPDANYGWAKLAGERMALVANQLGVPTYVVRPFSGYGEDQGTEYPFRAFVDRAHAHEDPFTVWGNPNQTRDFIHIDDVVEGCLSVIEADFRSPVNLCTGRSTSMHELAELCMQAAGYGAPIKADAGKPMGVLHRVGDPSLMQKFYTPKVSLEEGIDRALRSLQR